MGTVAARAIEGEVSARYRVLSLGAGVQSTTIAIMSAEGILPKLDFAIFADTGAEPQEVYDHLDRLEREVLVPAGIPVLRVQYGNLEQDLLDPNKMAMIPAYTASQWKTVERPAAWKLCGGDGPAILLEETPAADRLGMTVGCPWASLRILVDKHRWTGLFDDLKKVPAQAPLAELEQLADANPHDGPESNYQPSAEVTVVRAMRRLEMDQLPAPCTRCDSTGHIVIATKLVEERSLGMQRRHCTQKYKLRPIMEQVRVLLGGNIGQELPCRYCEGTGWRVAPWRAKRGEDEIGLCSVCNGEQTISRVGQPSKGQFVEQWIGFSTDEFDRASDIKNVHYSQARYPLLELGMSRTQCRAFLKSRGFEKTPKSACYFCPYRSNASWRRMRQQHPNEWRRVTEFDGLYRVGLGMRDERFLHLSAVPLDQAPIERSQRRDWAQGEILDATYEAALELEEEEDEVQGCSPHGCASDGLPTDGGLLTIQSRPAA